MRAAAAEAPPPRGRALPPPARARAGASERSGLLSMLEGICKAVFRCTPRITLLPIALMLGVLHSGQTGPIGQVSRMLSSAADVVESGSNIAIHGLSATGNFTSEVALWTKDALGTGRDLTATFVRGIDLVNVSITKKEARISTAGGAVLTAWLNSPEALLLVNLSDTAVGLIKAAAASVNIWMPLVEADQVLYVPEFQFAEFRVRAVLQASGHTEFTWTMVQASFQVIWCNPLWELLGFDPATETDIASNLVKSVIAEAPTVLLPNTTVEPAFLPLATRVGARAGTFIRGVCFFFYGPR